jgi:hypothetical protein
MPCRWRQYCPRNLQKTPSVRIPRYGSNCSANFKSYMVLNCSAWQDIKHYHNYRWFNSWQGERYISVLYTIRLALGPNYFPFQMEPRAVSPKVVWPERKADHSPPFNVKVKNKFTHNCTHFHVPSWRTL